MSAVKEQVRRIADELPEDATWEDVMERVYLQLVIDAGLRDVAEGHTVPVDEVKREFGLSG